MKPTESEIRRKVRESVVKAAEKGEDVTQSTKEMPWTSRIYHGPWRH